MEQSQAGLRKAATLIVDLYAQEAAEYATKRAALLEEQGDMIGAMAWQRVLPAIDDLLRERAMVGDDSPGSQQYGNLCHGCTVLGDPER